MTLTPRSRCCLNELIGAELHTVCTHIQHCFIGFCFSGTVQTCRSLMLGLLHEVQISQRGIMRQWFTMLRDQPCSCSLKTLMLLFSFEVIKCPILGNYIFPIFSPVFQFSSDKSSRYFFTHHYWCHSHMNGTLFFFVCVILSKCFPRSLPPHQVCVVCKCK